MIISFIVLPSCLSSIPCDMCFRIAGKFVDFDVKMAAADACLTTVSVYHELQSNPKNIFKVHTRHQDILENSKPDWDLHHALLLPRESSAESYITDIILEAVKTNWLDVLPDDPKVIARLKTISSPMKITPAFCWPFLGNIWIFRAWLLTIFWGQRLQTPFGELTQNLPWICP